MYRLPSHTSHGTYTSGKKCISILMMPSPLQASQRPPLTLKLKRPFWYPLILASFVWAKTSLMSSNTPVYVAGLERGVLPIGDWSISIILSNWSIPLISSCSPGLTLELLIVWANDLYNTSLTNELLPDPETPVTTVITDNGISTSTSFKLLLFAPFIDILRFVISLRCSGTSIRFLPLKYWPVKDFLSFITFLGVPLETISPPWLPAPGPTSTR